LPSCPKCNAEFREIPVADLPEFFSEALDADYRAGTRSLVALPSCGCMYSAIDAERLAFVREELVRLAQAHMDSLLLPEDLIRDTPSLAYPEVTDWFGHIFDHLKSGDKLLLYGTPGIGKTATLRTYAKALVDRGYRTIRGGNVRMLLNRFKVRDKIEPTQEWLDSGRVLILDDIAHPILTDYEIDCLYSILDRYDVPGRVVLMTANLRMDEIRLAAARRAGNLQQSQSIEALFSRLGHRLTQVKCTGKDWRR
jgi:hypothetical protein